jgi:hypothetical protein
MTGLNHTAFGVSSAGRDGELSAELRAMQQILARTC